jgi:hypothetical protein
VRDGIVVASAKARVDIGRELRERLEVVARAEGRDATSLARVVLRCYVEHHERRPDDPGAESGMYPAGFANSSAVCWGVRAVRFAALVVVEGRTVCSGRSCISSCGTCSRSCVCSRNDYVVSDESALETGAIREPRVDVACLINGIPLGLVETKAFNEDWKEAVSDFEGYRADAPELERYAAEAVATNGFRFRAAPPERRSRPLELRRVEGHLAARSRPRPRAKSASSRSGCWGCLTRITSPTYPGAWSQVLKPDSEKRFQLIQVSRHVEPSSTRS